MHLYSSYTNEGIHMVVLKIYLRNLVLFFISCHVSIFAQNMNAMPPYFKKGCYFTTTVKLLNILLHFIILL